MSKVYIVILNWNGWVDTIECLESIFRLNYDNYQVIICDNASTDSSLENIKLWAEGRLDVWMPRNEILRRYSYPPVVKPISYIELNLLNIDHELDLHKYPLILIQTGGNLGFAGGNNTGLKFLLKFCQFDFVWILNNDTIVTSDSLSAAVQIFNQNKDTDICGSLLLYYYEPEIVQAFGGGSYNKFFGLPKHIGSGRSIHDLEEISKESSSLSYIVGAAMLTTRKFLENNGLLCEDYFLFFEELDWISRRATKPILSVSPLSIVYHKEGSSTGAKSHDSGLSTVAEYYLARNRLKFTLKYHSNCLPFVVTALLYTSLKRFFRGNIRNSNIILFAIAEFFGILKSNTLYNFHD